MNITTILKRDGRKVSYKRKNIAVAMWKSLEAISEVSKVPEVPNVPKAQQAAEVAVSEEKLDRTSSLWKEAQRLAGIVENILIKSNGSHKWKVEEIQDVVEQVLLAAGHEDAAKAYILYRNRRATARQGSDLPERSDPSYLDMSDNAFAAMVRRYLWKDKEGNIVETPKEAMERVATAVANAEIPNPKSQIPNSPKTPKTPNSKPNKYWRDRYLDIMTNFEFVPAGCYFRGAGNKQNGSLANCFVLPVEDSVEAIFDAVKWSALIHQMGGGCISEGSKVFTTFCGLENFEVLYDRLGGQSKEVKAASNGWRIDLHERQIFTLALDPATGEFIQDRVTSIWRYELPQNRTYTIHARGGLSVTTSDWHPFFVYENDKVIEKRADEIQLGNLLITGNSTITSVWPFSSYQTVAGIPIDENIGWLVGYILGDGSFGTIKTTSKKARGKYKRLRIFDGRVSSLRKAAHIIAQLTHEPIHIQKDSRNQTYVLTCGNQRVVTFLQKLTGITGPKDNTLSIPSLLIKSPLSVISATLAGLIDSDGHVTVARQRVELDTESPKLVDQVASLLRLLGISGATRKKQPTTTAWKLMWQVRVDGRSNIARLETAVSPYITDSLKRKRLLLLRTNIASVRSNSRSPLRFKNLEPFLLKAGVSLRSTTIHRQAVVIGKKRIWLHRLKWNHLMSIEKMDELLDALLGLRVFTTQERNMLLKWKILHESVTPVVRISRPNKSGQFYDFTTERFHNYLAGQHGLTVVHNTGFNFSHLRPRGDVVGSGGLASGPINFMKAFDAETRIVMQGGEHRGANMGILNIDHPDIFEFIRAKSVDGEISNFNVSVGVFDRFMQAIEKDREWPLVNPRDKITVQKIPARQLWNELIRIAYATGDPGMIYLDTINKYNPLLDGKKWRIDATNVCGEQPLFPFDVCNLGSINLAKFVTKLWWDELASHPGGGRRPTIGSHKDSIASLQNDHINWKRLEYVIRTAVRFLDDGIDASTYPISQIDEMAHKLRRIGLGVMGWADMLVKLGIPYNSDEGIHFSEKIMKFIQDISWDESEKIASEKGVFPFWEDSYFNGRNNPFGRRRKVRNIAVTTIAPTGTISMIADCSSGIEPYFALEYTKNVVEKEGLKYTNTYYDTARRHLKSQISNLKSKTQSSKLNSDDEEMLRRVFKTAHEISPEWHVRMQAAFQKYTDNAVSKTINFPKTATIRDVEMAYLLAWKLGCKGITVYRDGSRKGQILREARSTKHEARKPSIDVRLAPTKLMQSQLQVTPLLQRAYQVERLELVEESVDGHCPECGAVMEEVEGCSLCRNCGYSRCSI